MGANEWRRGDVFDLIDRPNPLNLPRPTPVMFTQLRKANGRPHVCYIYERGDQALSGSTELSVFRHLYRRRGDSAELFGGSK